MPDGKSSRVGVAPSALATTGSVQCFRRCVSTIPAFTRLLSFCRRFLADALLVSTRKFLLQLDPFANRGQCHPQSGSRLLENRHPSRCRRVIALLRENSVLLSGCANPRAR